MLLPMAAGFCCTQNTLNCSLKILLQIAHAEITSAVNVFRLPALWAQRAVPRFALSALLARRLKRLYVGEEFVQVRAGTVLRAVRA